MVHLCNTTYTNQPSQELLSIFEKYPFQLDHFQKYAIEAIETQKHILITAHTGSGKTLPAEYAIQKFCREGKKVIYTSPIKSLSNQKYNELSRKFPDIQFGILTGDIKFNPEAQCIIMTTEILRNTLFQQEVIQSCETSNIEKNTIEQMKSTLQFQMDIQNELACVIFDEVHYINDADRGKVWEETIMKLPHHIQLVLLSATIDKSLGFAEWIERISERETWLASTNIRIVPLTHYSFLSFPPSTLRQIKEKDKQMYQLMEPTNDSLKTLRENNGLFYDDTVNTIQKITNYMNKTRTYIQPKFVLHSLVSYLKQNSMLPAICFVFSRKKVEEYASMIDISLYDETDDDERKMCSMVQKECKEILMKLPNYREYIELPEYISMMKLLEKGIAIHHSGVAPILREMVELLFDKGYIKMLFATETFAVGINMPTKTAIFTSLQKFSGNDFRYVLPHEYTQMAGRAGRRGLDDVGHVIHLNQIFDYMPSLYDYKQILCGKPQTLVSKFGVHFSLVLKMISTNHNENNCLSFIRNSMAQNDRVKQLQYLEHELQHIQTMITSKENGSCYWKTSIDTMKQYQTLQEKLQYTKPKQRRGIEKQIETIENSSKSFKQEYQHYQQIQELKNNFREKQQTYQDIENNFHTSFEKVLSILVRENYIECKDNNTYTLTLKGSMASHIQEINGLACSSMIMNGCFNDLSIEEIISVLSCFCGIRVRDEIKLTEYCGENKNIYNAIQTMKQELNYVYDIELNEFQHIENQDDYELCYELCDAMIEWCNAENEEECKNILSSLYEYNIFLGEFVKAILKINAIALELQKVCMIYERIDLSHKFSCVREKTMKYIATNQSLYI